MRQAWTSKQPLQNCRCEAWPQTRLGLSVEVGGFKVFQPGLNAF